MSDPPTRVPFLTGTGRPANGDRSLVSRRSAVPRGVTPLLGMELRKLAEIVWAGHARCTQIANLACKKRRTFAPGHRGVGGTEWSS